MSVPGSNIANQQGFCIVSILKHTGESLRNAYKREDLPALFQ